jgi:hypothetical protein
MTRSKHTIILVLMLAAFGLSAHAQSSARLPFEGAIHSYTVDGISVGAGYEFFITANIDGSSVLDDASTGEFDFLDIANGIIGADGLASINIQWNNGAAANIYYLWLEATIGGCSNNIRLEIAPQTNTFDMVAENIPVSNTVSCPAIANANGFNPMADSYTAGATTLQFKVRRENGTLNPASGGATYDWSFIPQLTVDPDLLGHINVIVSVEEATKDGSRYIVNGAYNEVLVTVEIQNAPGYDLDVSLLVTGQQESNTNLSDSDPTNDKVTHTIQVMPLIDGMGGV